MNSITARLKRLYGEDRGEAVSGRIAKCIEKWRGPIATALRGDRRRGGSNLGADESRFCQKDAVLIAYGDHLQRKGEAGLKTLADWCDRFLQGCVSTVHVLPFHPSTSYEGYAITDYMAVDVNTGSWKDLAALNRNFDLMFDLVLNHCSASHPWFDQFKKGEEPGKRYFTIVPDPQADWLGRVFRARNSPLVHPFETAGGTRYVWTTFSADLIDLNWGEPDVCLEFLEIIFDSVVRGARIFRLDAFVYLWKKENTSCVNQPEIHEVIALFQDVLAKAGAARVAILPSVTNVSQADNFSFFGQAPAQRKADLVYHLPLSALLIHTLYQKDATVLTKWLSELPPAPAGRAYLNLAATHDGIGLTWLKDVLPDQSIQDLIATALDRGALLSSRKKTGQRIGENQDLPWELNATYFNACQATADEQKLAHLDSPEALERHHVDRFIATQSVVLALRGVPAIYLSLLMAGANDYDRVRQTGDNRSINRGRFDVAQWEELIANPASKEAQVLHRLTSMLRSRASCEAFHPESGQRVLRMNIPALLAFVRTPAGKSGSVICLTNFGDGPLSLSLESLWRTAQLPMESNTVAFDLLSNREIKLEGSLRFAAYQVMWIRHTFVGAKAGS